MSDRIERARMLLEVERHEEAARELTQFVADEPEHAGAHALLALSLASMERWEDALAAARKAVGLAPEWPRGHYVLGLVLRDVGRSKEALSSAREARRLGPEDPDVHALVAVCFAALERWKEVLGSARRGLELDPEHVDCLNLRANALRILGRTDDARDALDTALAAQPDDPHTHTSYGFARLQEGDSQAALEHFREALRLDPSSETARAGLAEALKASNPLYRPILWWMLFSTRFSRGQSVLVVLGILFAARALTKILGAIPGLSLLAPVVLLAYMLMVWTSWVGTALFDLLLWLRRDTREVLLPRDRSVALCVGGAIAAALLAGGALLVFGHRVEALVAFAAFLAVAVPVAGAFSVDNQRARWVAVAIAALAVVTAVFGALVTGYEVSQPVVDGVETRRVGLGLLAIAFLGSLLSTWVLIGLRLLRPRPRA
ncbi:MAG TPA: tetratricopeptide repeat protein [Planctomycetota bacterium]|nr:tetratricopeptide repeat protein [Planctomycetota bacterium]